MLSLFIGLFMLFMVFVCLYPMLYVLFASLSESGRMMAHRGPLWAPLGFTLASYEKVVEYPMILHGYANTLFIVVVGVALSMALTAAGGFFLSRRNVKWQKPITLLILFTMFFGGGLVPFYLTVRSYGLDNTHWALIFPGAISTFNLLIMRAGFEGIPRSLEEAVEIDGGGPITLLLRVNLPLIKPTLAVLTLYYAVDRWNAWFYASVFLRDRLKYPLQLVLREILISNDTNVLTTGMMAGDIEYVAETIKYAVIIVATLPILCLYPFLQKYFVKGVLVGAVKE
ncbi:MAG: carbohydrate ABC transporter permease [Clostridiales bacterium]|jgi:putative aldouronate transport system permease protein|nr:carbohydrate ABC transporter permease [Clostridiales bacterium]